MKTSLRVSIVALFMGLFLITSLGVAWYTYTTSTGVVLELSDTIIDQVTDEVTEKAKYYLAPMETSANLIASLTDEHALTSQRGVLTRYMVDTIDSCPQLHSVYIGFEDGSFLQVYDLRSGPKQFGKTLAPPGADYVVRLLDRTGDVHSESRIFYSAAHEPILDTEDQEDKNFDPRQRPWYLGTLESGGLFWTDLYIYSTLKKPGITASVPVFGPDGKLFAVVAADVELDELSSFLRGLEVGRTGKAFIMNDRQEIVAFPQTDVLVATAADGTTRPLRMTEIETNWLREAVNRYVAEGRAEFHHQVNDTDYLASFSPLPIASSKSWVVGVVVPTDDYIGILKTSNRNTLLFSAFILLLGTVGITIFGGLISRPVRQLASEAQKIERFELQGSIHIPSRIKEVSELAQSMAKMKTAIQAFSKFVPKGLVKQLMESGAGVELGGQKRDLVVMFSDIIGFTSISESMTAEALALHISDYFDEVTRILMQHRGVIDKFIGDAVMAFWGAPFDNEDRYVDACTSLLAVRDRIDVLNADWEAQGKPGLHTRFGLHGGDSVVGNTGSSERMNYSAYGDVVNVASRLEGLNKLYGSTICVSAHIHGEVHEQFSMRALDFVAVKGRKGGTRIYELLARNEDASPEIRTLCELSALGLDAYLDRRWNEAVAHYEAILALFPEDRPTLVLVERCREYLVNEPSSEWAGCYEVKTK